MYLVFSWVRNKLKSWERSNALNCVILDAETILSGREFHVGTMRKEKTNFECHFGNRTISLNG